MAKNNNETRPLGWTTLDESRELVGNGMERYTADMWYHTDYKNSYLDTVLRTGCSNEPCWSIAALFKQMAERNITIENGTPVDQIVESSVSLLVEWLSNNRPVMVIQEAVSKSMEPETSVGIIPEDTQTENEQVSSEETDEWRDVKGYEGYYQVNRMGQVRRGGRILRPYKKGKDYWFYHLFINGKGKDVHADTIVAEAFIPNPTGSVEITYKDGDTSNYTVSNLEWYVEEETKNESAETVTKTIVKNGKPVYATDNNGKVVHVFASMLEAAKALNIPVSSISRCISGKQKRAGELFWHSGKPECSESVAESEKKTFGRDKKPVYTTDAYGNVTGVYESVSSAARETGATVNGILDHIKSGANAYSDVKWHYGVPESTGTEEPKHGKRNGGLFATTKSGKVKFVFDNATDASKELGISTTAIYRALSGRTKLCGGYYWFNGKPETEKVRINPDLKVDKRSKSYKKKIETMRQPMTTASTLTLENLTEKWKDIRGYKGIYQVSNLGEVKRIERTDTYNGRPVRINERVLKLLTDENGYLACHLAKDGQVKEHLVHRLVATAFIPNPLKYTTVSFKDGNKENCRADNLKWGKIKQF